MYHINENLWHQITKKKAEDMLDAAYARGAEDRSAGMAARMEKRSVLLIKELETSPFDRPMWSPEIGIFDDSDWTCCEIAKTKFTAAQIRAAVDYFVRWCR